jgi:hypothetical protein
MVFCGMAFCSGYVQIFRKNLLPPIKYTRVTFLAWGRLMQVRPKEWYLPTKLRRVVFRRIINLGWTDVYMRIKLCNPFPQFMVQSSEFHLEFCFSLRLPITERKRQWVVGWGRSIIENNHLKKGTNTRGTGVSKHKETTMSPATVPRNKTETSWMKICSFDVSSSSVNQLALKAPQIAHRSQCNSDQNYGRNT